MTAPTIGTSDRVERLAGLATALEQDGRLTPEWRAVFERCPRDAFAPDVIWIPRQGDTPPLRACDRRREPEVWAERVYGLEPVNIQVDDGTPAGPDGDGNAATSGLSNPAVVFAMLGLLDVEEGMRCMEIGTGPGWNAALLADRLGDDQVVSVEIDPRIAELARANLEHVGLTPQLVVGDGAHGWPTGAPYDRVIATCAVGRVPYPWVEQAWAGAVIVLPLALPWGDESFLVRLTVNAAGTASGRIVYGSEFMNLRGHRSQYRDWADLTAGQNSPAASTTELDPRHLDRHLAVRVVMAALVPGAEIYWDDTTEVLHMGTWRERRGAGSFARVWYHSKGPWRVEQRGPRHLWDEVETAYQWWTDHGRPPSTRFGLTVTSEHDQRLWYDTPDGPTWPLPPLPRIAGDPETASAPSPR